MSLDFQHDLRGQRHLHVRILKDLAKRGTTKVSSSMIDAKPDQRQQRRDRSSTR